MMKKALGSTLVAIFCMIAGASTRAVIFYSTADPEYNTARPAGELAGSGWDLQGDTLPGIPIAPHYFITATHVGGSVGGTFSFRGVAYPMIVSFVHPEADITIWQVSGTFPAYAPLYSSNDEVGKPLVVFGRGAERGSEVRLNGVLKGWAWGTADGILRWGENVVAGISDQDGNPADSATPFQLLRADFDANGGPNEAHLSGGDSGGSMFLRDSDGVWKLAGVNHAANKDYSETATGPGFNATLFDEGGFYEGELRQYHPDNVFTPQPGSFYATRISAYLDWIQSVISGGAIPADTVTLEESASLLGPYTPAPDVVIDPAVQTITLARPSGTRFFRVFGDRPRLIQQITRAGDQVIISYQ
jgi:hypothetical protein